jgi:hypothetical protein
VFGRYLAVVKIANGFQICAANGIDLLDFLEVLKYIRL